MLRIVLLSIVLIVFLGCNKNKQEYLQKAEALILEGKPKKAVRYLEKYIENDSSKPYEKPLIRLKLAQLYLEHDPKNKNILFLLEEAGEQKIYQAYALLSRLYRRGEILPNDPIKAFQFMEKASTGGDKNHLFTLGQYLFDGYGVPRNISMAHEYFLEAAENGNVEASNYLCELYTLEKYQMQSSESASKHCQFALKQELPRAIHSANLYQIHDDEKSFQALLKNASNQWVPSHLVLVNELLNGNFLNQRKQIFQLFKLNLESGKVEFAEDVNQLKALYFRYWQKYPKEANQELAMKYLNESRQAGQAMAMADWAILNLNNQHKEAREQLELAAKMQEPIAHAKLGELYLYEASGFSRDESAALNHLNAACDSKIITSCYQLGTLLSESYEIPRNIKKAFEHLSFAASNKHEGALNQFFKLSELHPNLVNPLILKKLQEMNPHIQSQTFETKASVKRPWQKLLDRSKNSSSFEEKSELLELSRKSLLKELTEGFELQINLQEIESELLQLQVKSNPFDTFDKMQSSWDLLQISEATKKLKDFFIFDGIKVDWNNNLKRLTRLEQILALHYNLQKMRIYDESYAFWNTNFDILDEYYSAVITYGRAHQNTTGPSYEKFEANLIRQRAEIALRLASIDHELERHEASANWINKAEKDEHPIHSLVKGRMLVSAQPQHRNDKLAWQILLESADKSPHIDSKISSPLPGGKAESLLLLSKMVASRRSPKKYWGKKHQYIFLKAASHYQPRYTNLLNKLSNQIDPRLALQAEKLAYRWINDNNK